MLLLRSRHVIVCYQTVFEKFVSLLYPYIHFHDTNKISYQHDELLNCTTQKKKKKKPVKLILFLWFRIRLRDTGGTLVSTMKTKTKFTNKEHLTKKAITTKNQRNKTKDKQVEPKENNWKKTK